MKQKVRGIKECRTLSNLHVNSRYEKRDKRRKTNIVLNTLITIVTLLILVIGYQLMFGGRDAGKTAKYNEQPDSYANCRHQSRHQAEIEYWTQWICRI